jgi:hypothetical protein
VKALAMRNTLKDKNGGRQSEREREKDVEKKRKM